VTAARSWTPAHEQALARAKDLPPPPKPAYVPMPVASRVTRGRPVADIRSDLARIGADRIADELSAGAGVETARVLSRDRFPSVVAVRRRLIALIRWSTGLSYPEIGGIFGLDHTSVLSAVRKREAELSR
jgi:Bacterial dnaA protein helix-turn-helix